MKIIIEANIPYVKNILEPVAEVKYLKANDINADEVRDANAILVRTRTICNETLLRNSSCSVIGTATIGTDHIDKEYCAKNNISVYSAPGCNAPAVAQYVISSIGYWLKEKNIPLTEIPHTTLGIVGVGNVGSIVERWAKQIGFKVLLNDPPRANNEKDNAHFVQLSTLCEKADIITFHVPLIKEGEYKTDNLCDNHFFASLKRCKLIINSARGEVVDNKALLEALKNGVISDAVIDCWEDEPNLNKELLDKAFIATPHIAGYSSQGKKRATSMILESLKKHFGIEIDICKIDAPLRGANEVTIASVMASYNPLQDSKILKHSPQYFEELRNNYDLRNEVV